jgi:transcriptional regulator with XRE-family HTH domain
MDWSKKIEDIKKELGFTTSELARQLECESHYVADIERGKSKNPSTQFIVSLIGILGINPLWLFLDEGDVLARGKFLDLTVEKKKQEVKELKERLQESNVDVKTAISMLNEIVQLKMKDQEKVMKQVRSLAIGNKK